MEDACKHIKAHYLNNHKVGIFDLDDYDNIKVVHGIKNTSFILKNDLKIQLLSNEWSEFSAYLLFMFIYNESSLNTNILIIKYLEIVNDINNNLYKDYIISFSVYDEYLYSSFHLIPPYGSDSWHLWEHDTFNNIDTEKK